MGVQHDAVYTAADMPEQTPHEVEAIRRAAVLVIAALTFPRMVMATVATKATESHTGGCGHAVTQMDPSAVGASFTAAEVFVAEAERRGYDPSTIIKLMEGLGGL